MLAISGCLRFNGLGAGLHAQDVPSDVGTKLFASDCPARSSFNRWTFFCRDPANATRPLPDELRLAPESSSESRLPTACPVNVVIEFHGRIVSESLYTSKRIAYCAY